MIVTHPPNLNYRQIRLRWCYVRLIDFLRRWGIYIIVAIFALGSSGIGSVLAGSVGLLALTVMPMLWALQQPLWVVALTTFGYCLLGVIVCWGLRPLLWSAEWRDVESALPIPPREQRFSDLTVVVIGLMPLFALYSSGAAIWLIYTPLSTLTSMLQALALLLLSMLTSIMSGMWILHSMRGQARIFNTRLATTPGDKKLTAIVNPVSVFTALIMWPLLRSPAKRAGRLILFVPLLVFGHLIPIGWPALTPWWLVAFSLLVLTLTTRLNAVLQSDLEPLHEACAPLPVDARLLLMWRRAVAMFPITVTLVMLLPALFWIGSQLRPFVAVSYVIVAFIGNLLHVFGTKPASRIEIKSETRVSVWLVILLVQIAIASEIMAR